MKFVFLMDPLHTVVMEKDTSYILMFGSHRQGHDVYFLPTGGLTLINGKLLFQTIKVTPQENTEKPFLEHGEEVLSEDEVDAVFIRTDPPFDNQYLLNTWLLENFSKRKPVINNPAGIRTANEKIWATQFTSLVPKTLISRNKQAILEFLYEEKEIIAKPTDGHGGSNVFYIKEDDTNARVILETLTEHWAREIIVQEYVAAAENGDKRIILLDGEPIGAVLRMHAEHDHRNNFFSGGKPLKTTINKNDKKIIDVIKPELQKLGLYFVGIDILGTHLVEVNVTSPTGVQEINRLNNDALEERVVEFVEKLVDQS